MSLDVYFLEDISRRLDALEQTARYMEPGDFQTGFVAAIQAVRVSFGLRKEVIRNGRQGDGGLRAGGCQGV